MPCFLILGDDGSEGCRIMADELESKGYRRLNPGPGRHNDLLCHAHIVILPKREATGVREIKRNARAGCEVIRLSR